ncbi:MAG: tetratricopeptide repeat protein [Flammeovirgaceae bacterium]|nr:tetratricopeptide repeat protein [Flammeovirgaceae bacterium]
MLRTRIILVVVSVIVITLIFLLPKRVVENDPKPLASDNTVPDQNPHTEATSEASKAITALRQQFSAVSTTEKNATFADSLATLYNQAGKFDSAAWFAEKAAAFFKTVKSQVKAGDNYYQAYTFALEPSKQEAMAAKAQEFYSAVLETEPTNLEVRSKMAMTYLSSTNPMQGIMMLREVLEADPKNESALFNLGMLSIQSGQYDKAVDRLKELIEVNPQHIQGQLLLGVAFLNLGKKKQAREQFEKVKEMDQDPSVQATVDSYLKDLK